MKPGAGPHGPRNHHRLRLRLALLAVFALLPPSPSAAPSPLEFTPPDNYLLDCGAPAPTTLPDGRTFRSDAQSSAFLSTAEDLRADAPPDATNSTSPLLPLHRTSRIFLEAATYSFFVAHQGLHWIRLHFLALPSPSHNLTGAVFTVIADNVVLLHDFSTGLAPVVREYLLRLTGDRVSLVFTPKPNSVAFVNAIEVVSAPETLIRDTAASVSPQDEFTGLSSFAFEVVHRLNVGGPTFEDELWREWRGDAGYLRSPEAAENVTVAARAVRYPDDGVTSTMVAPRLVYASAVEMADAEVARPDFNVTWDLKVDPAFTYLLRLHFCDIVSKTMNDLYFDVYLNGLIAAANLDLSTLTSGLKVAYFKDFVVNSSTIVNSTIRVQVGPAVGTDSGSINAILNGVEVMKMSNDATSLDGLYSADGSYHGTESGDTMKKILAAGGLSVAVLTLAMVAFVCCRWHHRPAELGRRASISSWLLPVHGSQSTFTKSNSKSSGSNRRFSSKHSKGSGYSSIFASGALGLGRFFSFAELQEATNNFDEKTVLGVGGFGKVYLAELEDGTKLAVKRGNPSSDQGMNEFLTEIQMLSKLRHRHLVSLMGYCDEDDEMILVYEYMTKGPLTDHLYGRHPPLTWRQRLEACIGAARGLHYLHTGVAEGIIHRDVKSANILLDENLVAKVADFGLSKAAPTVEQKHVSTAVKGSFGYLDPEYFRCQQLTDKSDVYSFGVVLVEALCARPAINTALPRDQVNLAEWAMQWHRKGMVEKIIDPHLAGKISSASLRKYVEAAEKCLANSGADRPSMGDVLWSLEYALQLHEAATGHLDDEGDEFSGPNGHLPLISEVDLDDEDDGASEPSTPLTAAGKDIRTPPPLLVHGR